MEIATKYANGEEQDRLRNGKHKSVAHETGGGKQKRKAEPAAPGEALVVTQGKFKEKAMGSWNRKATASAKEAFKEGGIENPPLQGEKRTASEDPETKASKRGKKSSPEGPALGGAPAALFPRGNQPSSEP